jgi:hypothetical protein
MQADNECPLGLSTTTEQLPRSGVCQSLAGRNAAAHPVIAI